MKELYLYSAGTSQTDRMIGNFALEPLPIDGKTDGDFFNFIFDFARSVAFWNDNDLPQGDWQRFFAHDVTFLLATIKEKDLSTYPAKFHKLLTAYDTSTLESDKEELQVQLLQMILGAGKYLATWSSHVQAFDHTSDHKAALQKSVDESLQSNIWLDYRYLRDCIQGMIYLFTENPNTIARENLAVKTSKIQHALASILYQEDDPAAGVDPTMVKEFSTYPKIWNFLLQLYDSLYRTLVTLKQQAELFIEQSLSQSDHSPQVALLFSLLDMMKPLKQRLNSFTIQHLDFYYRQVLLQKAQAGKSDVVPIHFVGKTNHPASFHPAGTALISSNSREASDGPVVYHTTKPLTVTGARPIAFKTIYNGIAGLPTIEAAHQYIYTAPIANSLNGQGEKLPAGHPSWPTLGSDLAEESAKAREKRLAQLGWAISSSLLLAAEGQRSLQLFWELPGTAFNSLEKQLTKLGLQNAKEGLPAFLESVFDIAYTAPKAWEGIQVVEIELSNKSIQKPVNPETAATKTTATKTPPDAANSADTSSTPPPKTGLLFTLSIAPTKPPIVAYQTKVHKGTYDTDQPVLRFALKQRVLLSTATGKAQKKAKKTYVNPYALLKDWSLQQGTLQIGVKGVQNFAFQNDFSLLKSNAPFNPFGVKPLQGNHFYLGNTEVFGKPLSSLSLEVEWYDLPQLPNGFCQYYESYNKTYPNSPFYNSVFKWDAALLLNQSWQSLEFIIKPKEGQKPSKPVSKAKQNTPVKTEHPIEPTKKTTTTKPQTTNTLKPQLPVKKDLPFFHFLDGVEKRAHHLLDQFLHKHHASEDEASKKNEPDELPKPGKKTSASSKHPNKQLAVDSYAKETTLFSWQKSKINQKPSGSSAKGHTPAGGHTPASASSSGHSSSEDGTKKESEFHQDAYEAVTKVLGAVKILREEGEKVLSGDDLVSGLKSDLLNWVGTRAAKKAGPQPKPPVVTASPSKEDHDKAEKKSDPSSSQMLPPIKCPYKEEGKLNATSTFQLAVERIKWPTKQTIPSSSTNPLKYGEHSKNGFLRLELVAPSYAFGHEEERRVIAEIAMINMSKIAGALDPNHPILPPGAKSPSGHKTNPTDKPKNPPKKAPPDTNSAGTKASTSKSNPVKKFIGDEITHLVSSISPFAGWLLKEGKKVHIKKIFEDVKTIIQKHRQAEQKKKDPNGAATAKTQGGSGSGTDPKKNELLLPPRPAYTPKIKGVTVDYESRVDFSVASAQPQNIELFHLCPFDMQIGLADTPSPHLLPQYLEMGYLYMGLEKIKAPEKFTLLFELNEATGNRDLPLPAVQWAYYTDGKWARFPALAVQDGTKSFTESGVIELSLPAVSGPAPFKPQTAKAPSLYWLRASVDENAAAVCETIQVYPHATLAKRRDASQAQKGESGSSSAIHPKQIKKLQQAHPAISKVVQPVASSGGTATENDQQMYIRVSEQLRHKGRAITAWDYERLVLQAFPDIGFVRCLNHTSNLSTIAPGQLHILILPVELPKTNDRLSPKTSPGLRLGINRFLESIADPLATINVKNPSYDYVTVEVEVDLRAGSEQGKVLNTINKKLIDTIANWTLNPWTINPFTHSCSYYTLLSCVNQEEEVIEIVHFAVKVHRGSPTAPPEIIPATFELIPHSSPWSILTSVAKHKVTTVQQAAQANAKSKRDKTPPITPAKPVKQAEKKPLQKKTETGATKTTTPVITKPEIPKQKKKPDNALFIHSNWYDDQPKD